MAMGTRLCIRLRQEFKDLVELVLLPGTAIFLPWPLCFRLYRYLSRYSWLYGEQTAQALAAAQSIIPVADPARWCAAYRLIQLVDHGDLYLSLFRSDRWMCKYLSFTGSDWPKNTPFLAITFHWGTGLWSLRHLRSQGITAAFLSVRLDKKIFAHRRVAYYYARLRLREVERVGSAQVIYKGGSVPRLLATLRQGKSVVALIDVPPSEGGNCLPVQLFQRQAWWPSGLVRLAVNEAIPAVAFTVSLNHATGQRYLHVTGPLPSQDQHQLVEALAGCFSEAISRDSPAWHFWWLVQGFFK
ncbi:hypothetical protein [Nitrosococcus wardiae]|uniref:Lipid A biosynthesis acyltransferase n=1 Tax=Nitrosococcus wardiae TaxID=1814290 RepID=A0A4P7BYM6_9GAMM|nr:hypothetical protein [Nitrosococcus wardiae]QBQ53526.1 hypothetical protein E3U44_02660 [Nitrosococcus wardiae]